MIENIINSEDFREIVRRSRARELHELTRRLYHGAVVVYGEAGMGKTALLKLFQLDNPGVYINTHFLRGYEIELDDAMLLPFLAPPRRISSAFPELMIIDDVDQVISPGKKEKVAEIIRESWRMGHRVVVSATKHLNEKVYDQYASSFHLGGLSEQDTEGIIALFENRPNMAELKKMLLGLSGNPKAVLDFLHFVSDTAMETPVIYHNPVLIEAERPKLITDVRLINQRLIDRIGRKADQVRHLSPREFEVLVSELLEEQGYEVELTKKTRDGGKDIIVMSRGVVGDFMVYAECKHYAPHRKVGLSVISDLHGRVNADGATAGMVVTSSYFSPDAKDFQLKLKHKMNLIDFIQLSSWIEQKA